MLIAVLFTRKSLKTKFDSILLHSLMWIVVGLNGVLCFSHSAVGQQPSQSSADLAQDPQVLALLKEAVGAIADAGKKGDDQKIRMLLSRQYVQSINNLRELLKSGGRSVEGFDKRLLKDFDFYSVDSIGRVILKKDVAFVQCGIVYDPTFLSKNHSEATTNKADTSIWNNLGGKVFMPEWERKGQGVATYYFVRQNDLYKLHMVNFSSVPLSEDQINSLVHMMSSLIGPNKL